MIHETEGEIEGLVLWQVDDSLGIGGKSFILDEEEGSKVFRIQPRVRIGALATTFNGHIISKDDIKVTIFTTQENMI